MNTLNNVDFLRNLTLKQLREKVKDINEQSPKDEKNVITYSKNFTLSLSNYCVNQCRYCFFNYKIPKISGPGNIILLGNEQIENLIQEALEHNCKEALLMSGERPDNFPEVKEELKKINCLDFIEFIKDICTYLLDFNILPHTNLGLLTYNEMKELKQYNASMGLMLESTSMKLFEKDGVHEHSLGKLPVKRIEHINNAGELKIPFTTGLLLGIGESIEDVIRDLYLIRNIHKEYGHIQEVIIQNFVSKDGISYQPKKIISLGELLKITGIAKIIFENEIAIQVPPNLIAGFEKDFIDMGIDDFGGISPLTVDYINPDNLWPQIDDLNKICEEKGYKLRERLPIYKKFIKKKDFCPKNIKKVIDNIDLDDYNSDF